MPRLALDVMACEVLRVLQLTPTALVPVSYLVPRKVRGDCRGTASLVPAAISRGDASLALGDKGQWGAGRPQSSAWGEQERR